MKKLLLVLSLITLFSCSQDDDFKGDQTPNCVFGVLADNSRVYLGCATRIEIASGNRVLPDSWYDKKYVRRETKEVKNCDDCK